MKKKKTRDRGVAEVWQRCGRGVAGQLIDRMSVCG